MTVNLTWTPGSGATQQTIQYRLQGATTWTTHSIINNNTQSSAQLTLASGSYQFRILNDCTECICSNGTPADPDGYCLVVDTIAASQTGTAVPVTRTPYVVYGDSGTVVHTGLSPTSPFTRLNISNPFWIRQTIPNWDNLTAEQKQAADLDNGPVNRLAIWGVLNDPNGVPYNNYTIGNNSLPPTQTWIGFDVCINIQTTKTYYVAIAADNFYRFSLDGLIILSDLRNDSEVFNYLHIYPVTITAGSHILRLEGFNSQGFAGFGCEIFDLDNRGSLSVIDFLNQQTSYTNLNVVFTTRGVTQFSSNIFTCPEGYDQINPTCNQVMCTRTNYVPCENSSNIATASQAASCPPPSVTTVTLTPQQGIPHP